MSILAALAVACGLGVVQALPSHPDRLVLLEGIISNIHNSLSEAQDAHGTARKLHSSSAGLVLPFML